MKDFQFFMKQGNFLKVVDTLEKYQSARVNVQSDAGQEFVLFKRQLYQMYEVQNRSIYEHEAFSMGIDRKNLKWLYTANIDYVNEITTINELDNAVEHGRLKGAVFKQKFLSPTKAKGLAAFGLSVAAYAHLTTLTLMLGPTYPAIAIVALGMYGANAFNERDSITQIDYVLEGDHAGALRIKIAKSPLQTYSIIANVKDTRSICALGDDDLGADDVEGNILQIDSYINEATGESHVDGVFSLPADANRSKAALEWIFAHKAKTVTDESFAALVQSTHMSEAATGGLTGISAYNAKSTGYANMAGDESFAAIESDVHGTEQSLRALTELYGKDELAKMKPADLYKLYKRHSVVQKS